jgi:predicted NUDIX family NTP pyrophosphohydrolase
VEAVPKRSAGLLLYRMAGGPLEVLIVHPGGPLWARREEGAWSLPKGEVEDGDDPVTAAREFQEELGSPPPEGDWIDLGEVTQSGGKRVHAFALEGDLDAGSVVSGTFEMEWPPRSGQRQRFPEIDRAKWVRPEEAGRLLIRAQMAFVERLTTHLSAAQGG